MSGYQQADLAFRSSQRQARSRASSEVPFLGVYTLN